ncbi:HintC [Xylographa bjoerkii]|nr:HintC [Xylographa bjoerkii]
MMDSHPSPPPLDAPSSSPPSDLDPDLAAQMGFASFGAQPTAKKRKYNPAADAMTSFLPPAPGGLPKKPPLPLGTGANSGALGKGRGAKGARGGDRVMGRGEGRGTAAPVLGGGARRGRGGRGGWEKRLGEGEGASGSNSTPLGTRAVRGGEDGAAAGAGLGVGMGDSRLGDGENEEEEEEDGMPGYVDSTPAGSPLPGRATRPTSEVGGSSIDGEEAPAGQLEEEEEEVDAAAVSETPRYPTGSSGVLEELPVRTQQSASRGGQYDWNTLRKGVRNESGDVAYYDASFVEDPWRDLVGGPRGV